MTSLIADRLTRYKLVSHACDFIFEVLPFRRVDSFQALDRFTKAVEIVAAPKRELDSVLIRVLAVLDRYASGPSSHLLSDYLNPSWNSLESIERFRDCVRAGIRYLGVEHPLVREAIHAIEAHHTDSQLSIAWVAGELNCSVRELSDLFARHTGVTFTAYRRNVRLDRAAVLLATTSLSVKEVWAGTGFNDASNFDHDFKRRFGTSPKRYRQWALEHSAETTASTKAVHSILDPMGSRTRERILVVEDNENTRDSLTVYLRSVGYEVNTASTGTTGLLELSRLDPATVVLDYHLPDMDGITWLRRVRQASGTQSPPVLLLSADWDLEDQAPHIRDLGAVFVVKLCDLPELARIVQSLCTLRVTLQ